MYEWDEPKPDRQAPGVSMRRDVLEELLGQTVSALTAVLKPEAMREVSARAQHVEPGWKARSLDELAQILFDSGDLTTQEVIDRSGNDGAAWLARLQYEHRIIEQAIPTATGAQPRWVHAELAAEYRLAFAGDHAAAQNVLRRYLRYCGPVTFEEIRARYGFEVEWLHATLDEFVTVREIARGCFTPEVDADEYCDLRFLEQVHQRSLTLRRKEVKTVAFAAYADFLLCWQHAHPTTHISGETATAQVLQQLHGMALPAVAWERDVLPARLTADDSAALGQLLGNGEVSWVASGREARRAHLRFLGRGEGGLFLPSPHTDGLSTAAATVYESLRSEGASFGEDIESATGLTQSTTTSALVELVLAGLVTNDSLPTLRAILEYERPESRSFGNSLEAELAVRRTQPARLTPTRLRVAKQRVRARLEPETRVPTWNGRWSLVHRTALMGKPLTDTQRAERLARLLLERYGIIARECMEIESIPLDWATLFPVWERMEMRGEIRRGYFVQGLSGLQFALPEAVEALAASTAKLGTDNEVSPVVLSAVDPANLFGLPDSNVAGAPGGPKFARVPSTHLVVISGQVLLVAEDNGARISLADGVSDATITAALKAHLARPNAPRQTVVEEWNGQTLSAQNGEPLLGALGFSRSPKGMERWSH
jgi:ATP-dependent Lhr-like helicase